MNLEHEFTVPVPIDEAWKVLLDVERIAPCMPGATLLSVDGDQFTGQVKVKVGPIQVTYKGQAKFAERDDAAHRVVIEAAGKESRGSGTAAATVTAVLVAADDATTNVRVETDLNVTGRPAQFGRGVLAEVGAKLVQQFASCLADELAGTPASPPAATKAATKAATAGDAPRAGSESPLTPQVSPPSPTDTDATVPPAATTETVAPAAAAPAATTERPAPRRSPEAIDLLDTAGAPLAKRLAPVAAGMIALFVLLRRFRRR